MGTLTRGSSGEYYVQPEGSTQFYACGELDGWSHNEQIKSARAALILIRAGKYDYASAIAQPL